MELLTKVLGARNLARWPLAAIALTTGACIFLPDAVIERLLLDGFVAKYGVYIGIAFLLSSALLVLDLAAALASWSTGRGQRVEGAEGPTSRGATVVVYEFEGTEPV